MEAAVGVATTATTATSSKSTSEVRLSPTEASCSIIYGSLSDKKFNRGNVCLVVGLNSVSCKNVGLTKDLVHLYPYSNVADLRYTKQGSRSIAQVRDRDPEGTVILHRPPIYKDDPAIATFICQFGIGAPIEINPVSQQMLKCSYDSDLKHRLQRDTSVDRIFYFEKCLRCLERKLENSW